MQKCKETGTLPTYRHIRRGQNKLFKNKEKVDQICNIAIDTHQKWKEGCSTCTRSEFQK